MFVVGVLEGPGAALIGTASERPVTIAGQHQVADLGDVELQRGCAALGRTRDASQVGAAAAVGKVVVPATLEARRGHCR
jgi:hypothetical protein